MLKDERNLLDVLKFELEFLDKGGYGRSVRESWRPVFVFEDSPTCMNYDCKEHPAPCSDCVLMQLVPPELRLGKTPCRQIPLNSAGETLDSLYRWGDEHEIEDTLRTWLVNTISQLELRLKNPPPEKGGSSPAGCEAQGTALHENLHPKCANPACATAFHCLEGGKFLRFRPDEASRNQVQARSDSPKDLPGVKRFWLCERCSHVFTLVSDGGSGVMLKVLRPELPLTETLKELPIMRLN